MTKLPREARQKNPGPAPTAETLREAALAYLARYGTTRAALSRFLARKIDRWARAAAGTADPDGASSAAQDARGEIAGVVARLAEAGAIDDAAFASSRARALTRAGKSRRAVSAHLAMRGVGAADASAAMPGAENAELAAAVATARRRRLGPFRASPVDADGARRELGVLARAGFPRGVAAAALRMDRDTAESLIRRLRLP